MDYLLPVTRLLPGYRLRVPVRSSWAAGELELGRSSYKVDRIAYFGIFLEEWYAADFRNATVVDIGAHKGYFGAYALLGGAAHVHSYEPESANFAVLARSAATFGPRWRPNRAAVGAASGTAELNVSAESAGHSVVWRETEGPRRTVRSESVAVIPMTEVLMTASPGGRRQIVKIDAEGMECDIVLGTSIEVWRLVDTVFLEIHDFAPCSVSDILDHLRSAGLQLAAHELDEGATLVRLTR